MLDHGTSRAREEGPWRTTTARPGRGPPAPARRARADRRLHGRRGRGRPADRLPGAAGRRRPHAHRRGRHRARPGGDAARGQAGLGRLHLRPEARRDPVRPGQRADARGARGGVRRRGRTPAPRPAGRRRRGDGPGRSGRDPGEPLRRGPAGPGRPTQPEHRRRVLAHRHRPGRLRRDAGGRARHLRHRVVPGRRRRDAGRGRADGVRGVPPAARQRPDLPRGLTARDRAGCRRGGHPRRSTGSPTCTSCTCGR